VFGIERRLTGVTSDGDRTMRPAPATPDAGGMLRGTVVGSGAGAVLLKALLPKALLPPTCRSLPLAALDALVPGATPRLHGGVA